MHEFERRFEKFNSVKNATFVDSGSKAILMAIKLLGLVEGDEVVLPTYLCHSVIDAIIVSGATPVLCDVSDLWNLDVVDVERVFSKKTRCIIIVHTMGIAVEVEKFRCFNVPIIEDCCQAIGAKNSNGKKVGAIGDFSVFSFHAIKCLTTGEGGMLCINNPDYLPKTRNIQFIKATVSSMTDLQGALGISQLDQYSDFLSQRRKIGEYYLRGIESENLTSNFKSIFAFSNCYRFLISSGCEFESAKAYFSANGIAVRKGVDELLHRTYPIFSKSNYNNSEYIFNTTISIPIYPSLPLKEQTAIIDSINSYEKFR